MPLVRWSSLLAPSATKQGSRRLCQPVEHRSCRVAHLPQPVRRQPFRRWRQTCWPLKLARVHFVLLRGAAPSRQCADTWGPSGRVQSRWRCTSTRIEGRGRTAQSHRHWSCCWQLGVPLSCAFAWRHSLFFGLHRRRLTRQAVAQVPERHTPVPARHVAPASTSL